MTAKLSDTFFCKSIPCEFIAKSADFQVNTHLKRHLKSTRGPPEVT